MKCDRGAPLWLIVAAFYCLRYKRIQASASVQMKLFLLIFLSFYSSWAALKCRRPTKSLTMQSHDSSDTQDYSSAGTFSNDSDNSQKTSNKHSKFPDYFSQDSSETSGTQLESDHHGLSKANQKSSQDNGHHDEAKAYCTYHSCEFYANILR